MSDLSDYHRLYDSRIYYPLLYRTIVSYREVIYNPAPDLTLTFMPWAPDIQEDSKIPNSDAYTNTYLE